jgi:hypothetical protein
VSGRRSVLVADAAIIGAAAALSGVTITATANWLTASRRERFDARRLFHADRRIAYASFLTWCDSQRAAHVELN